MLDRRVAHHVSRMSRGLRRGCIGPEAAVDATQGQQAEWPAFR